MKASGFPVRVSFFNDEDTRTAFTEGRIWYRFDEVRYALTEEGEPRMILRSLRHTAVCNMLESGVPVPNISKVTGHTYNDLRQIGERYAVATDRLADAAMMAVHRARGGDASDFDVEATEDDSAWRYADAPSYKRPAGASLSPGRYLGAALGQHRLKYVAPWEWPDDEEES